MARTLSEQEKEIFIENREQLHEHLSELQADLEDMTDEELIECRSTMLERVNWCMRAILETDEDNAENDTENIGIKCGWEKCKFNENGMCYQEVHFVARSHPSYNRVYNLNSEDIKQNCRCLYPDLGQYIEKY